MKRRTSREKALQALFQIDLSEIDPNEAIDNVLEDRSGDPFINDLVFGVLEHKQEIDDYIRERLQKWSLERIGNVDRAILRIAIYEMKYIDDVPIRVSMNEAIELAKIFGDDESSKFINGVLSKIAESIQQA